MTTRLLQSLWLVMAMASLCGLAPPLTAAELNLQTQRVVVFKDGYGLFVKSAKGITDDEGRLFCDQVPDEAILGSVWADAENARLKRLRSKWVHTEKESTETRTCQTIGDLLKANLGNAVTLTLNDDTVISGTLRELIGEPREEGIAVTDRHLLSSSSASLTQIVRHPQPTHVLVTSTEGDVLVPIPHVQLVRGPRLDTKLEVPITTKEHKKQFVFEFDKPNQEVDIVLVYFRPGIRWIPTYRVNIDESDTDPLARVQLQAEFLNEAEALENVPIDIVVGVPNFRFRQTPSPLTLEAQLKNTLQQAAPALMNQMSNYGNNAMFTQRSGEFRGNRIDDRTEGGEFALPEELTTVGTQDLFVYHLEPMTLDVSERAAVELFDAKVPFRHVYTWDVNVRRLDPSAAPTQSGSISPLVLSENQVWHQIELTNNTDLPWTTGAAMLTDGAQPLSQELLTYTSIGSAVRIPVTVAVDLRGTFEESETDREYNSVEWQGYKYAKITKRATLKLANNKRTAIDFEINCHVGGRATESSQEGAIEIQPFQPGDWENYNGSTAVNNHSVVRWSKTLKPGEVFEATVDYHFYARQ